MNELKWMIWLFPLLFILHDMEEIILAKHWCSKGYQKHFSFPLTPFGNTKNTAGFSIAVYEELLLGCIISLISIITGFYGLWMGLLIGNIAHLILLHIILLPLCYHRYVPGLITSIGTLFPCCYLLYLAQTTLGYSAEEIILWTIVSMMIELFNVKLLHKKINALERMVS